MQINGEVLRIIRERSGYSGAKLAEECELSPQHLSDIELGKRNASPAVAKRLAKVLDVPLMTLVRREAESA